MLGSGACGAHAVPPPLAITDVALIDGVSDTVRPHQTVIVRGGKIVTVGPAAETPVPRGARRIDGRGRWLMPGLWDMHVHASAHDFARFSGPLMLAWGVTGADFIKVYSSLGRAAAEFPLPATCRPRSRCWRPSARASGASSTRTT